MTMGDPYGDRVNGPNAWENNQAFQEEMRRSKEESLGGGYGGGGYGGGGDGSSGGGCLGGLVTTGIGCVAIPVILVVVAVVATGLALFTDLGPADDGPSLADEVRWDGTYQCGADTLGLTITTRLIEGEDTGGIPLSIDIAYFSNPPSTDGAQAGGEPLGVTSAEGTLNGEVIGFTAPTGGDPTPIQATGGILTVEDGGGGPDRLTGELSSEQCDAVRAVQRR